MSCIKGQDLDLLVVVDDLDIIKLYMHRIKESLLTLKPIPIIMTRSIFDLENEKSTIRCKKVLFLISATTDSLETKVDYWCKQLPLINGNSNKFLIISTGIEQESSRAVYPGRCIIRLENLVDISSWWSHVLKFLCGENLCCVRFGQSDFFTLNMSLSDREVCKLFDRVTGILEGIGLTEGADVESAESIIVVLNNPADLEIQRKLITLKKQCKRNYQSLHIICTQGNTNQLYNYTDSVYNRDGLLKLLLWLQIDLGLLNASKKDLQTKILQNCSKELFLKVAGAVLWLAVGLPVMLVFVFLGFAIIVTVVAVIDAVVVAIVVAFAALVIAAVVLSVVACVLTCGRSLEKK